MICCQKLAVTVTVTVARLSLAAWVGAAMLFVITSVAEQRSPAFDSIIRDQLATLRFPWYYMFGTICLSLALVGSTVGALLSTGGVRKRLLAASILTLLSGGIAGADYACVYSPLQSLIEPPGKSRTEDFIVLHERSRLINEIHLGLALLAAVVICIPESASGECRKPLAFDVV